MAGLGELFSDGFESGDTSAWSASVPPHLDCPPFPAFPDASCTGPSGALPLYTGSLDFYDDGVVIENVEIRASRGLYVPADNVTFRNVQIVYTGALDEDFTVFNLNYNSGTLFERVEIDGQSQRGAGDHRQRRHGAQLRDPPRRQRRRDRHAARRRRELLPRHLQPRRDRLALRRIQTPLSSDGVTVRHNTILLTGSETGAINIMGTAGDPATDVLIEKNLFAGGGYTLYAGVGSNYRIVDNHLSTRYYPRVGYYNIWYWEPDEDGDVLRSGNVIAETGAPADENLP